jgi:hypothetical protein
MIEDVGRDRTVQTQPARDPGSAPGSEKQPRERRGGSLATLLAGLTAAGLVVGAAKVIKSIPKLWRSVDDAVLAGAKHGDGALKQGAVTAERSAGEGDAVGDWAFDIGKNVLEAAQSKGETANESSPVDERGRQHAPGQPGAVGGPSGRFPEWQEWSTPPARVDPPPRATEPTGPAGR